MKLRKYFLTLMMSVFALVVAPVSAQDEASDSFDGEEMSESTDDEDEGKKSKKKARKKSKKDKGKKAGRKLDDEGETADAEAEEDAEAAVPAAMKKFKLINGKFNAKAEFYVYLYTASTCMYCQGCMPMAVKEYKKMSSGKKVEMIVIDGDGNEAAAKKYLKRSKLKAPAIMFSALQATNFRGLPGCGMPGLPAISIADKDGKVLVSGVGATRVKDVLTNWRNHTTGK